MQQASITGVCFFDEAASDLFYMHPIRRLEKFRKVLYYNLKIRKIAKIYYFHHSDYTGLPVKH